MSKYIVHLLERSPKWEYGQYPGDGAIIHFFYSGKVT
jgi:hypothetical protein